MRINSSQFSIYYLPNNVISALVEYIFTIVLVVYFCISTITFYIFILIYDKSLIKEFISSIINNIKQCITALCYIYRIKIR